MTFLPVFRFLTYGVAASGFVALMLTGELGSPGITIAGVSLILSWPALERLHPGPRLWQLLTIGFLAFLGAGLLVRGQPVLQGGLELLLFLQCHRLFNLKRNRDFAFVFLFAFLQILLAVILTIRPALALVLVLYMLLSAWALLMLEVKRGIDLRNDLLQATYGPPSIAAADPYVAARALLRPAFLLSSGSVSLLMLFMTLGLFLATPRLELNLLHRSTGPNVHVAGFSEDVRLGEVGTILQSPKPVMRVQLESRGAPIPSLPYWRGQSLDYFDGKSWSTSLSFSEAFRTTSPQLGIVRMPRGTDLIQRYVLEPLDSPVLFVMPTVLGIELGGMRVSRSYTGAFEVLAKRGRIDYRVFSSIAQPSDQELATDSLELSHRMAPVYLQLPPLSDKVKALAEQITRDAATPIAKVRAIETWLRSQYTYTLEPENQGSAPLEDFLFRTREGHCEYFASAFVVLARSIGLPSRIVNGFVGGDFNELGRYWVVRQKDAHSWAEVRFKQGGWIQVDPTPSAGLRNLTEDAGTVKAYLREYADYLELQWYFYVLDYDLNTQLELFSEAFGGVQEFMILRELEFKRWSARASRDEVASSLGLILGGVALLSGAAIWLKRRKRETGAPPLTPHTRRFLARRQALHRQLERRGLSRRPDETPLERAARATEALELDADLEAVERTYYAHQFGHEEPDDAALRHLEQVLKTLRALPLRKRGA